ncbi:putative solute carrier family 35 member SLC35F1/F2/F6 [Helianthus annuus]|nr:putative solute carrier family 35 member SLC35F1/F2/F6 [Helianthus annuus]KAJ0690626.1 putative solute carrier family 35 member SLC35F1/F2/F6 [Helianthus annuus]
MNVSSMKGINAPTSQSLANYVMLAIVYGGILLYRRSGLKAKWYYYLLLGLVDVEANYLVVKAYQYTSITSIMLLDCWSIPSVILLTWLFLKTKYRYKKTCATESGSNPIKGDFLVVAGATLYAVSNVSEEFFVKTADRIELMAMFSVKLAFEFRFTFVFFNNVNRSILEREELKSIHWSSGSLLPYTGFAAAMFLFYSGVPVLLKVIMSEIILSLHQRHKIVYICIYVRRAGGLTGSSLSIPTG